MDMERISESSQGGCGLRGSVLEVPGGVAVRTPPEPWGPLSLLPGPRARTGFDVSHLPLASPPLAPTQTRCWVWRTRAVGATSQAREPLHGCPSTSRPLAQHVPWSLHCHDRRSVPTPPQGTQNRMPAAWAGGHCRTARAIPMCRPRDQLKHLS